MRKLFLLLLKSSNLLFFIALQVVCAILIIQYNPYHKASFLSTSNGTVGKMNESATNIADYLDLKKVNDSLAVENQRLYQALDNAYYYNQSKIDTACKAHYNQSYTYQASKVVQNTFTKSANYITINRGKAHGVKVNSGLIGPNGIVGIVTNTSDNYSLAMSFLNKRFSTSGRIKGSNYFGPLLWDNNDIKTVTLKNIPDYASLNIGDTIETTGFSHIFPEGIMIGVIKSYDNKKGEPFFEVKVTLSSDFSNLNYVYVVNNLFADEINELEKNIK